MGGKPIKYVGEYNANDIDTDETLINYNFRYLMKLNCNLNENFTDKILKCLPNITTLNCGRNEKFTDEGLKYLPNLIRLYSFAIETLQMKV
jgi:hypothetical protein